MGKTKYLSAFEQVMVVGLCHELQPCWVFHAQQFPVCIKNGPPPKGHPANLTPMLLTVLSTWASILWNTFDTFVESMLRQITAVLRAEGQINIKVFLMCCALGVYITVE